MGDPRPCIDLSLLHPADNSFKISPHRVAAAEHAHLTAVKFWVGKGDLAELKTFIDQLSGIGNIKKRLHHRTCIAGRVKYRRRQFPLERLLQLRQSVFTRRPSVFNPKLLTAEIPTPVIRVDNQHIGPRDLRELHHAQANRPDTDNLRGIALSQSGAVDSVRANAHRLN